MDSILNYTDYRLYLKSYFKKLPRKGHGELKKMAEHLRISSTYLSQILSGVRDLPVEQAFELQIYLGFNDVESEYFLTLVQLEKAGTENYRRHLKQKREQLKQASKNISKRVMHEKALSPVEQSVFYSSWLYSAIRAFCSIDKGKSRAELKDRFGLTNLKLNKMTDFMLQSELLKEEASGLLVPGARRTYLEQSSEFIQKHHLNWRLKSMQKAESLDESEMMYSGPMSISRKDFDEIRERLVLILKDVFERVSQTEPEEIACLNMDLFYIK